MANAGNTNVVFTMKFDPSDLSKLSGQIAAALGGKSAAASGGGANAGTGTGPNPQGGTSSPSFMSIFKPLLALEGIKTILSRMSADSNVAKSYLGAMGKLFGAAIDLLLIPFTPIFNLILVGMGKLVEWLAKDDVQKAIKSFATWLLNAIINVGSSLINYFTGSIYPALQGIWGLITAAVPHIITGATWIWNAAVSLGIISSKASDIARDIAIVAVASKFGAFNGLPGGKNKIGLLGGIMESVSGVALAGMLVGGAEGAFKKVDPNSPRKTTDKAYNILSGAGTFGGVLPNWPKALVNGLGINTPDQNAAKRAAGNVPDGLTGANGADATSIANANVNITVNQATDRKEMDKMIQDAMKQLSQYGVRP